MQNIESKKNPIFKVIMSAYEKEYIKLGGKGGMWRRGSEDGFDQNTLHLCMKFSNNRNKDI